MKKQFSMVVLASAALLLTLVSGCATTPQSDDEVVSKLARERWDLVLEGNYVEAYEYYSPGYRSSVSLTDYIVDMKLRRVRWVAAELQNMDCSENVCALEWRISYEVYQPVPGMERWSHFLVMQDDWIKTNGKWWYVPPKPTD